MSTLKFAGFTVGQTIRAQDFQPRAGRGDCYVQGKILEVHNDADNSRHYAHYVIRCTVDMWDGAELSGPTSRVSELVFVPMENGFMDWDTRVVVVTPAPVLLIVEIKSENDVTTRAGNERQDIAAYLPAAIQTNAAVKVDLNDAIVTRRTTNPEFSHMYNDPHFAAKARLYKTAMIAVDTNFFSAGEYVAVRLDPTPEHPLRFRCFNNKSVDAVEWLLPHQLVDFVL